MPEKRPLEELEAEPVEVVTRAQSCVLLLCGWLVGVTASTRFVRLVGLASKLFVLGWLLLLLLLLDLVCLWESVVGSEP